MNHNKKRENGQVMVLTIMVMGGVMLSAITIAGMLTLFQIRQSGDITRSTEAIYAADAGSEWALYQISKPSEASEHPWKDQETVSLSNGSEFRVVISAESIRSFGKSANTNRAFEVVFGK